uniref:Si:dkey-19b23.12 n=1 Tax=Acanthochromis polyacanthus TaxID=80966 RepID=A0A3Q1FT17_9TELE
MFFKYFSKAVVSLSYTFEMVKSLHFSESVHNIRIMYKYRVSNIMSSPVCPSGAVYRDDCPLQPYIPIYLIVGGTFTLMVALLSSLPCAKKPEDGATNPLYSVCLMWNLLVSLFLSAWFIAGNVWIYSIYPPNYNKNSTIVDPYCDKTLYLFAFWITTVGYILLGSFLFLGCCCFLTLHLFLCRSSEEHTFFQLPF